METVLATTTKRCSYNFWKLNREKIAQTNSLIPENKLKLQSATWSECTQNAVEFLVCVVLKSTITLSKICTRRTSDKPIIFKPCLLDVLPGHSNIMAEKELNLFDDSAVRCAQLSPQEEECISSF